MLPWLPALLWKCIDDEPFRSDIVPVNWMSFYSSSSRINWSALPSFGNWTSFCLIRKGGNLHLRLSSSHSVFSFTLYIYSSFIKYREIYWRKSSSLACSRTVSRSSSFLSAFSLWMSLSSFVAALCFYLSFLIIFRQSSTSSWRLLYCLSFSRSASS